MGKLIEITQDERKLPYYKFYESGLPEIPQEKLALLEHPQPMGTGIPFADKDDFITMPADKGYAWLGYGENADGTAFAANQTFIPDARPEMLEWYFLWEGIGPDIRYRIWNPEDHYFSKICELQQAFDSSKPIRERIWNTTFVTYEDIGAGPMLLSLYMRNPEEFGFSKSLLWTDRSAAVVCGGGTPAAVCHKCRKVEGGMVIDSYFWVGYMYDRQGHVSKIEHTEKLPFKLVDIARLLYGHNLREMGKLATVLAPLYAEEGGKL